MENLRYRLDVVGVASQEGIGTAEEKQKDKSSALVIRGKADGAGKEGIVNVEPSKAQKGQEKAPGTKRRRCMSNRQNTMHGKRSRQTKQPHVMILNPVKSDHRYVHPSIHPNEIACEFTRIHWTRTNSRRAKKHAQKTYSA